MDKNEIVIMKNKFDAIAHYDEESQIEFGTLASCNQHLDMPGGKIFKRL